MKTLYIIGGTMGIGKTATCRALTQQLSHNVFLDGDWCWDANPFTVTDETKKMVMQNISYLLNNFIQCSEYENIIFCWVLDSQEIIDELLANLELKDDCQVELISLVGSQEILKHRIGEDIKSGNREVGDIERSIARLDRYTSLNTRKVDVDSKSSDMIAAEIISN